ncbi:hypothetical protein DU508_11005 [Pedobacter chinensis]|uniref:Peptidase S74 domain-containing protein n=1 Tax=Pedobacter chinensis TaxID=2282421 RepID=A0A369PU11_9SPHI|nr:hypothetical protein [Pedobacter chinensis]RDC56141.1 hypothetical protein DU508_11005 [Pedobacter chinensis]
MKNNIAFVMLCLGLGFGANAQTTGQKIGANPTIKEASALLELEANDKGILMPRVALTSTTVAAPVTAPADALTVFNTATTGDVIPGYYYWSAADVKWIRLTTPADYQEPWNVRLTNNKATLNTQNIYQEGNVAIGTTSANNLFNNKKLYVNGNFRAASATASPSGRFRGFDTQYFSGSTDRGIMLYNVPIHNADVIPAASSPVVEAINIADGYITQYTRKDNLHTALNLNNASLPNAAYFNLLSQNTLTDANSSYTQMDGSTVTGITLRQNKQNNKTTTINLDALKGFTYTYNDGVDVTKQANFVFPLNNGQPGQVLTTNGAVYSNMVPAVLSWQDAPVAIVAANNGLTKNITTSEIELGGGLNRATIITTDAANTLAIAGLQTGAATDKVVVADNTGILKTINQSALTIEPWQVQGTTDKATTNTQNIFQTGSVAIGKSEALAGIMLDVAGAVRGGVEHTGTAGTNSVAFGRLNIASGGNTAVFGYTNTASGGNAAAFGYTNTASGSNAAVFGSFNTASGTNETVLGRYNSITSNSTALLQVGMGVGSFARANALTILGGNSENLNRGFVGIGQSAQSPIARLDVRGAARFGTPHANEVSDITILGTNSFAAGTNNRVSGTNSAAFGTGNTVTSGDDGTSVAMGYQNIVSGLTSIALGSGNTASGGISTALGYLSTARGNVSTASGWKTIAPSNSETVIGKWNAITTGDAAETQPEDGLFQIGSGFSESSRSNALTILKNGRTAINVAGTEAAAKPTELLDLGGTATAGYGGLKIRNINSAAYTGNATTDKVVVADNTGILKTVAAATIAIEPLQIQGTTNKATANTDNVYQMGKVAINKNTSDYQLEVAGDFKANYAAGGGLHSGIITNLPGLGMPMNVSYLTNNTDILSATEASTTMLRPGMASLQSNNGTAGGNIAAYSSPTGGTAGFVANNAAGNISASIWGRSDGSDNHVTLSHKKQAAEGTNITIDKLAGVTFEFQKATDGSSEGNYVFPRSNGTANQVLATPGGTVAQLAWTDVSALAPEPWFNVATGTAATANTQNIYQNGKVGIGFTNPNYTLEVGNNLVNNGAYLSLSQDGTAANGQSAIILFSKRNGNTGITGAGNGNKAWKIVADADNHSNLNTKNKLIFENWDNGTRDALFAMIPAVSATELGKIGIGTATPTGKVHIKADVASDPLRLEGLQTGVVTDKIVVADVNGVLKTVDAASVASSLEPWQVQGGTTKATTNAQNIYQTGSVAVGASTIPSFSAGAATITPKFHVAGDVSTTGAFYTTTSVYADYVFEKYFDGSSKIDQNYTFKSLAEVNAFIKKHKHLPGVTPISDVNKTATGYSFDITKLSVQSLEKIEELYLHTIEQQNLIEKQQAEIQDMKTRLERLERLLLEKK